MNPVRALFTPPGLVRARAVTPANVREPQIATAYTTGYHQVGGTMIPEWDAESAVYQAYLANVFVYACVTIIANTIASLPIRVGKNPDKPQDYNLDAPLARLLGPPPGSPNPDTGPSELKAHAIAQYLVTGRFGWELEWSGKPGRSDLVAIWPLIAQHLEANPPGPGERSNRFFTSFSYMANGQRKTFTPEEVYYDWKPSQHSWHQPESALQAARLNISGAVMQDIYDYAFLKNDARPAAVVVTEQFASIEDKEKFERKFNGKFGGPANAGKAFIAEVQTDSAAPVGQMIDIKTLGLSQKDSEAVNRYSSNIKAIVAGLGVPLSKLDASGRTFSNAEEENKTWWNDRLLPLITKLQESLNVRLAPLVGDEVCWFDISDVEVLRKAKAYSADQARDAYDEDVITKNEYREVLGEEQLPDGDKFKSEYVEEPQQDPAADQTVDPQTEATATEPVDPEPADVSTDQPGDAARSLPAEDVSRHTSDPAALPAEPMTPGDHPDKPPMTPTGMPDHMSTGVMVAFHLTPEQARELVIPGYQPADDLHLTLGYCGKITDSIDRNALEATVAEFAANHEPMIGSIGGKGMFHTPDGIAVVALVDAPGLGAFRQELVEQLSANGVEVRTDHDFTAHITLAYVDSEDEANALSVPTGISMGWQHIGVSWGEEDSFYELGTALAAERREQERTARWQRIDAQITNLESPWVTTFRGLFTKQEETVLNRLEGKRGRQMLKRAEGDVPEQPVTPSQVDVDLLFDAAYWTTVTVAQAHALYETVVAFAGSRIIDDYGLGFDISQPYVQDFINARANMLAGQVTDTTYQQIKEALISGVAEGEGIEDLARRVRHVFDVASKSRSINIARTEVISAYNMSSLEVAKDYGPDIVGGKSWLATRDARVRDSHRNADGQVRSIVDDFLVGSSLMAAPGDPRGGPSEICQCRCTLELIAADEWADRSRSPRQWRRIEDVEAELIRIALEGASL